jgi:hypothetical protein
VGSHRHGHVRTGIALGFRRRHGCWLGPLIHRILAVYLGMPLLQRHYYTQVTEVAVIIGDQLDPVARDSLVLCGACETGLWPAATGARAR